MSIVWMIYFAGISKDVSMLLTLVGIVSTIVYIFILLFEVQEVNFKFSNYHPKKIITALSACLILAAILPSEKTIYMMAGASIAQDIASNPKTIATMDKVYKLIDGKLDEQIKQVAKDNKEK